MSFAHSHQETGSGICIKPPGSGETTAEETGSRVRRRWLLSDGDGYWPNNYSRGVEKKIKSHFFFKCFYYVFVFTYFFSCWMSFTGKKKCFRCVTMSKKHLGLRKVSETGTQMWCTRSHAKKIKNKKKTKKNNQTKIMFLGIMQKKNKKKPKRPCSSLHCFLLCVCG